MIKIFLLVIVVILVVACNSGKQHFIQLEGNAQGTTYHISYFAKNDINYKSEIDGLLREIDSSMSTYLPVSIISRINKNDSSVLVDDLFKEVFLKAMEVSDITGGKFDVTVGPLVNGWGFGVHKTGPIDSARVDSLRSLVSYKMVSLHGSKLVKQKPGMALDFNAIAQGYSVDIIANYLELQGIQNYLVELGGELKAKGKKSDGPWKVGIDMPSETETQGRPLKAVITLNDKALSTSGNYRKFYIDNGQKYAHTIDPLTGFPAKQNLLSATVIAHDCITADAYATAFMVMGLHKAKEFLQNNKALELEVYFIYDEKGRLQTYMSESLQTHLQEIN